MSIVSAQVAIAGDDVCLRLPEKAFPPLEDAGDDPVRSEMDTLGVLLCDEAECCYEHMLSRVS